MREKPLTEEPVSKEELLAIRSIFGAVNMKALMQTRLLYRRILSIYGYNSKAASTASGLSQASMIAAAAAQNKVLGGFTQPITVRLVSLSAASVKQMFEIGVDNGLFDTQEGEKAPAQLDGEVSGGRGAQIFHATALGVVVFRTVDLGDPLITDLPSRPAPLALPE